MGCPEFDQSTILIMGNCISMFVKHCNENCNMGMHKSSEDKLYRQMLLFRN